MCFNDTQLTLANCRRFQGLKVEVQNRQRAVDFINQSAPVSKNLLKADRANLAEELGSMNRQYQAVASSVSEQLKQLDTLLMQWKDYEDQVDGLTVWFAEQDTRLGSIMQLHRPAAVQQAIKDCKVMFWY